MNTKEPPSFSRAVSLSPSQVKKKASTTIIKRRKIGFKEIEIIELPVGLGDNPGGRDGPPVSCCYAKGPQLRFKVCLEKFEHHRPQRRSRRQLRLCKRLREKLLLKHGYSSEDISRATLEARKTRFDRVLSVTTSTPSTPSTSPPPPPPPSKSSIIPSSSNSLQQQLQQQHPNLFTPSWMIRRSSSYPSSTTTATSIALTKPPPPPLPSMAFQAAAFPSSSSSSSVRTTTL